MNKEKNKKKVLVALSGGIDSSATCLMLQEQGYEVLGLTLRVYDLPCQFRSAGQTLPDFILEARAFSDRLGMKHYVADVRAAFESVVIRYFIDDYLAGRTPNPCVLCNAAFKFPVLLEWAGRLGCDYIATGHYARVELENCRYQLYCGADEKKDQSYFLWRLGQDVLSKCLFPLGRLHKNEVRDYLERKGFGQKARGKESMEVCFIAKDYRDFLRERVTDWEHRVGAGWFVDTKGRVLGQHAGFPCYTVGQRRKLGISLKTPVYVLKLNAEENTVVLGHAKNLRTRYMWVGDMQCTDEQAIAGEGVTVCIRYHSRPLPCRVRKMKSRGAERGKGDDLWLVHFGQDASAVTPGQSAVFYIGRKLAGGACICSPVERQVRLRNMKEEEKEYGGIDTI
ncbi:MAG: tRNA 2-thiouridine(34) synthase MnmA [Paraprevotella sp.]|nr:tRNA 2-thiouridine(34) synthase MnmA [Paraprevotella sp.]